MKRPVRHAWTVWPWEKRLWISVALLKKSCDRSNQRILFGDRNGRDKTKFGGQTWPDHVKYDQIRVKPHLSQEQVERAKYTYESVPINQIKCGRKRPAAEAESQSRRPCGLHDSLSFFLPQFSLLCLCYSYLRPFSLPLSLSLSVSLSAHLARSLWVPDVCGVVGCAFSDGVDGGGGWFGGRWKIIFASSFTSLN